MKKVRVCGIDVFCGAGGLTYGMRKAGVAIVAGIDLDPISEFPFTWNNHAKFIHRDVRKLDSDELAKLYPSGCVRLLAGCAPCRPFSPYRRGTDNSRDEEWGLLNEFSRLAIALKPELLTIENVPGLASKPVFHEFIGKLMRLGYSVDWKSVYCPRFGIPQHRRRLVLIASLIGPVKVPTGSFRPEGFRTVRDTIATLPKLAAGEKHPEDCLHRARSVTKTNLRRLRSSRPGGTWRDWPKALRSKCHRKQTGSTYRSVYARMCWDEPAPTITTQAFNFGTGRFGRLESWRSFRLLKSFKYIQEAEKSNTHSR